MENKRVRKTILIVEDDLPILNALVDKLTREGFNILKANDGEEGFKKAIKNHPDMLLLDIVMPKMDGISMIKKLRVENKWGKNVPIIILTNLSPEGERINSCITENEPIYYLVKTNWSIGNVVKKIKEVLNET